MKDQEKKAPLFFKKSKLFFRIKDAIERRTRKRPREEEEEEEEDAMEDDDDAFFRRRKKRRRFFPRVARVSSRAVRAFGHGRPNVTASAERRFSDVHV